MLKIVIAHNSNRQQLGLVSALRKCSNLECHELNIPAAIGVGDETFDKIIEKNKLILNCKENKIYLD